MYDVTMQYCPLFLNNRNTNCWDTCVCDVPAIYVLRHKTPVACWALLNIRI